MIATITAFAEKKVQRSNENLASAITAIAATTIAEIDFSSISAIVAIVAIIWKPLSSDHSDRSDSKITRRRCLRSRFSRWMPTQTLRKQSTCNFLWRKYKDTIVFTTNFQRNIETSARRSTAGMQSDRNSPEHKFSVFPAVFYVEKHP